ncbi:MAG: carbon storage regulator CsrA [Planctomycetia bacterium]
MLVLSRQLNESIRIGDDVVITIIDVRGDNVRLGIKAPSQVPVHRQEVFDLIRRQKPEENRADGTDSRSLGKTG